MVDVVMDWREVGNKIWLSNGKLYEVVSIEGAVATLKAIEPNIPEGEPVKYLKGRPVKVAMREETKV